MTREHRPIAYHVLSLLKLSSPLFPASFSQLLGCSSCHHTVVQLLEQQHLPTHLHAWTSMLLAAKAAFQDTGDTALLCNTGTSLLCKI